MLLSLHIENVAIIKTSDIDFFDGFNVLTGETGAGKSIIIDSINLLLGNKSSREIISSGCDYAFVSAVFTDLNKSQLSFLSEYDIYPDEDSNIIISRKITKDGRNISKINSKAVNVSTLKEISSLLISIHGQHDGSKILNQSSHIEYLDEFCKIEKDLEKYRNQYSIVKKLRSKIVELNEIKSKKQQLEDSIKFKINEIEKAQISNGEYEKLKNLKVAVENSTSINSTLYNSENIINSDEYGLLSNISLLINELSNIDKIVPDFKNFIERLKSVKVEIEDISEYISKYLSNQEELNLTPDYIEDRLYTISQIINKYGSESKALIALEEYKYELSKLDDNETEIDNTVKEYSVALQQLEKYAYDISKARDVGAKKLEKEISAQLNELDMPNVVFKVEILRNANSRGGNKYTLNGYDNVEFLISTNAGQNIKPLSKIASGGEMSRILLCLKTILNSNKTDCPSVVYDEIDTGVSGSTAQKIGYKLKNYSKNKQVFCVTHLAQIAALADVHFKVEKDVINGETQSKIKLLSDLERRSEIARIMGGADITEQLLKSADELINASLSTD